jgi:hypothetical protein
MTISQLRKNTMGTMTFDGKFPGMRKAQDFIVYPISNQTEDILIQSDTRIGRIHLTSGVVTMSPPRAGGSYNIHLMLAKQIDVLSAEDLLMLKAGIFSTASGHAGSNGLVYVDNKGALDVFSDKGSPSM